jgi:predicted permease
MTDLIQDLRYALRQLRKNRGFTIVAVLTLALGIGVNSAIFSVVNGVLLNPLPFSQASHIVSLFQDKPNFPKGSISYPNLLDWQRENRTFEAIAGYRSGDGTITGMGQAEDVRSQRVSATFFPILGVNPILGRNFIPEEDRRGANPTILISEGLWKRKFASDPNVIGRRIIVAGQGRTIIGVIPASFHLEIQNFQTADIYEPLGNDFDPAFYQRDSFWGTDAIGLLKPSVTLEQARADLKGVNAGLASTYPDINAHIKTNILTLKDEIVGDVRPMLLVLLGAVGFVLLIACVNVANLLLARSTTRRREFSIRIALGAGQKRLVRQLLTEAVLLAMLGGGLGLILAKWGTPLALAAVPTDTFSGPTIPRVEQIGLDARVLLFTFSVSVLTGIAFGLVPGWQASRANVNETLKDAARTTSGHRSRAQASLVIAEMAMAMVLLVGAGLMLRTLVQLWRTDPGFDAHNVLNFTLTPAPSLADQSPDAIRATLRQIDSAIRAVPGVESLSMQTGATLMESDSEKYFITEGQQPTSRQADLPWALDYIVEPQYFKTMRISLLRGRFLTQDDNEHSARVAVIDNSFARKYFPGQDPVGKHLSIFDFDFNPNERTWIPVTVVGVVAHVSQFGLARDPSESLHAQLYRSVMQSTDRSLKDDATGMNVFVRFRSSLSTEAVFQAIRKQLSARDADTIVSGNDSEEDVVARTIAGQRFALILLGVFAGVALLLASIGIYGVLSYLVGQRTREIGLRMALGARRLDVLRLVVNDGARMTLIGAAIGLFAALGLTQLMSKMLFGVQPTDPITFVFVGVLLCSIALMASYLPARRAAKVDPMVALRYE